MAEPAPAAAAAATCENCETASVTLFCADCKMEFCDACDADFHRPAKKASHVRKARFPTAVADILKKCEKDGKASDYGSSKAGGKDIVKYVLEYDEGYYYLWKNRSADLHLDAELDFKTENLQIIGFESATKLKISLPPASEQYLHLKRVDSTQNCTCEITQRFALNVPKAGKLPSIYVPVVYTIDTPVDVLRAQTEREGLCTDHGSQDQAGMTVHQFQWEFTGGYCFLWTNSSKDIMFHKEIELELKNLRIQGKEEGEKKYVVDLKPGASDFMILQEIEPKAAYGVSMRAGFSLTKIKPAA